MLAGRRFFGVSSGQKEKEELCAKCVEGVAARKETRSAWSATGGSIVYICVILILGDGRHETAQFLRDDVIQLIRDVQPQWHNMTPLQLNGRFTGDILVDIWEWSPPHLRIEAN